MAPQIGKIGLVGAGAVGGYYGLMLKKGGEDIHFHIRSNFEKVREDGFCLVHHLPERKKETIQNVPVYRDSTSIGICNWIIIATKATANEQVMQLIRPMVDENTSFLTLQNGMGNVEIIAESYGENRVIIAGLCFTCINRTEQNRIESILPGYVQFGQHGELLSEKGKSIVNAFERSGIRVRYADSLEEALWRKLCWNIPFNGLSIVGGGITTDLILANQELRKRARQLMIEIQSAAIVHGVTIEDTFLDKQFELTEGMGPYRPSSLIDFVEGKPVEVEAIFGVALRKGNSKGIEMAALNKLYTELLSIT
ncbi:2-dehydropantoate 2-reductase [Opitutales bacterium]|nr:2-dehydropantoate 2-reductase [Opitutales bacterium]